MWGTLLSTNAFRQNKYPTNGLTLEPKTNWGKCLQHHRFSPHHPHHQTTLAPNIVVLKIIGYCKTCFRDQDRNPADFFKPFFRERLLLQGKLHVRNFIVIRSVGLEKHTVKLNKKSVLGVSITNPTEFFKAWWSSI